ncbi:hypothetical protein [Mucisphaera calidilacus]|uniref:Outer membrane protein n=1 Tax=Mucisphaera calidilacus TaxID=2527982 RepID=A0A518BXE8_9BACT|nr:hypothetical protein [Mucisphaera calidilacus]QDU71651.1 hypothetical protein Pan265_15030 [Mucisphaera calidilacus]
MKPTLTTLALVAAITLIPALTLTGQQQPDPIRIGVYDNRAIAIAYAASESHNQMLAEVREQYEKAKADDNKQQIRAIGQRMQTHQEAMHFQGFGRAPVNDLLEPIHDDLRQLAADLDLAAITRECDVTAANVETVDITEQIVELYNPSERTRNTVASVRKADPIPLTTIAHMGHNH